MILHTRCSRRNCPNIGSPIVHGGFACPITLGCNNNPECLPNRQCGRTKTERGRHYIDRCDGCVRQLHPSGYVQRSVRESRRASCIGADLVQSSTKLESYANNHDWASSAHRSWWRAVAPTTVASNTTVTTPRTSAWGLEPETSQGALVCWSLQQRPSLICSKFDRAYDYSQFARVCS
jgi:hypothetical protein